MSYRRINAYVKKDHKEEIMNVLREHDICGYNFTKIKGEGEFKSNNEHKLVEGLSLEILTKTSNVDKIKDIIIKAVATGGIGDGIISVSHVEEVIRIRNQEEVEFDCIAVR